MEDKLDRQPKPINHSLKENGASIYSYTSQYHHESKVTNLLIRSPTLCWFTSIFEGFPQNVIIDMGMEVELTRVGLYLHGKNNQNPSEISFESTLEPNNSESWKMLVHENLEHRGGDFLYDLKCPTKARYVRYTIYGNFGGSGAFTTKLFLFGL